MSEDISDISYRLRIVSFSFVTEVKVQVTAHRSAPYFIIMVLIINNNPKMAIKVKNILQNSASVHAKYLNDFYM